jgi:hypothetical protein
MDNFYSFRNLFFISNNFDASILESKKFLIALSHEFNKFLIFSSDIFGKVQKSAVVKVLFKTSNFE